MTINIESRTKQVFADVMGVPVDYIQLDSSPLTIEAWDSLQHVVMVEALGEEFSIKIEPEYAKEMLSVEKTLMIIKELIINKKTCL